ncbi:MAG: sulfotransferase, partial [Proteobacteria bacterium]|nr:sulfotransferase [Pseudomonadota bacterium]
MANFVLAAPSIENPYASGWEAAAAGLFNAAMQHEAAGRFDEAFELFAEANRIKRARLDGEQYVTQQVAALAQVRSIFTREFLQSWGASGSDLRPIFIVGMPRSGSTLVEQILASHPTIQGLGETGAL